MAQTTIYVPDRLWERIKSLRDEEIFNISAICQRALESEVTRLELQGTDTRTFDDRAAAAKLNLDQIAKRISRQRTDAYQVGYDAVIEWARDATYADLMDQRPPYFYDQWGDRVETDMPDGGAQIAQRLSEERSVRWEQNLAYPGWRDAIDALWTALGERFRDAEPIAPSPDTDLDDLPF